MEYNRGKKIRLGLFILLGTLVFVAFFYLIGSSSKMFSKSVMLQTQFKTVSGLRTGNHVRFSGIIIGTVSDLQISTDTSVYVEMSVDRKMLKFIRKDSRVEIKPEALIGDKMLVIYSGSTQSEHVRPGDFLAPVSTVHLEDVVHKLSRELETADVIIKNLVEITAKVNKGDGNVGRILNDSSIALNLDRTSDHLQAVSYNMRVFSEQINNPNSDLGKLINEDHITNRVDTILFTLGGAVSNTEEATLDLARTSAELRLTAEAINNGNGALSKLLYDSAFADTIDYTFHNLNQTLLELEQVAKNLQHKRLFGGSKEKK
jgi:phospholipid/cholesterol/gamma-HCH transport system substrate-binding protein